MLVHFAELVGITGAHKAAQAYRDDPTTDNHDMMTRMIWAKLAHLSAKHPDFVAARKKAKAIFLGLCYGMGSGKLALNLGMKAEPRKRRDGSLYLVAGPEGQRLLDLFKRQVPYVSKMAKKCQKRAEQRGYIRTLSGRKCRFPENANGDGGFDWTFKALNRLIQGSAGDQTKTAMVDLDDAGQELQLQVHDEVCQSVDDVGQARDIGRIMETCVDLRVPSKVDIEIGPSWGEAKEIDS